MKYAKLRDANLEPYGRPIIPIEFWDRVPLSERGVQTVQQYRQVVRDIMDHKDPRKVAVMGFCSVHNKESLVEFLHKIQPYAQKYSDKLVVLIRECFEKPRTNKGWRGLIPEPGLDGIRNYHDGYIIARELIAYTVDMGLPIAMEFLNRDTPQIIDDGVSFGWIGARTAEHPETRGMVSGLSMPTGIKNHGSGNLQKAIDGIITASTPDEFTALHPWGFTCPTPTKGNKYLSLILRGAENKAPNYDEETVRLAQKMLTLAGQRPSIMIDCSHDNIWEVDPAIPYDEKKKDTGRQLIVGEEATRQMVDGNRDLMGIMMEVHLEGGNKKLQYEDGRGFDLSQVPIRQSITDPCVSLEDAIHFLENMHRSLRI